MKHLIILLSLFAFASSAVAQTRQVRTTQGAGAVLRVLDTLNGQVEDYTLDATGQEVKILGLYVTLSECRYPRKNISRNAYAHLTIRDVRVQNPAFEGWMIASSPALSALEHPRYDVWVTKCTTSDG